MPVFKIEAYVPASPEQVFSHVTAFPARGEPNTRALEERYGQLLSREGDSYTFQDKATAENQWQCAFEPPRRRVMRSVASTWADRIDIFEPSGEGTHWTLLWEPKTRGAPALFKSLFFRFKDRKELHARLVQPVLDQFRQGNTDSREYY